MKHWDGRLTELGVEYMTYEGRQAEILAAWVVTKPSLCMATAPWWSRAFPFRGTVTPGHVYCMVWDSDDKPIATRVLYSTERYTRTLARDEASGGWAMARMESYNWQVGRAPTVLSCDAGDYLLGVGSPVRPLPWDRGLRLDPWHRPTVPENLSIFVLWKMCGEPTEPGCKHHLQELIKCLARKVRRNVKQ